MGGGNRGKRGRRKSYAVNRPGAPAFVQDTGPGQRGLGQGGGGGSSGGSSSPGPLPSNRTQDYRNLTDAQIQLQQKLDKDIGKIIVDALIQALILSNPFLMLVYAIYNIVTIIYPIAKTGLVTYEETGDKDRALASAAVEAFKQGAKVVVGTYVGAIAGAALGEASNSITVKMGDTFVEAVAEDIVEDFMPG
jgi:hypothetical protein